MSSPSVLLCGIPSEPPLAMVAQALTRQQTPFVVFNQRHSEATTIRFTYDDNGVGGALTIDHPLPLSAFTGIYSRVMDFSLLPELKGVPEDDPRYRHAERLHQALSEWCEVSEARVVNRLRNMGSNGSKPYQAQCIRKHGFSVPETLISNDPEQILQFKARHQRVVFKSVSGIRSIVRELDDEAEKRLMKIRWCPTQFQAWVPGVDMRIHAVGQQVFATEIRCEATDYRYARGSASPRLVAAQVDGDLAARCVALSRNLGLALSGIDLRITPEGEVFCFEVNPSPAYSYYQQETGQPIAESIAAYLAGRN